MKMKPKSILAIALCAVGLAVVPSAAEAQSVTVDALSNEFTMDLTVGDRVAADIETLVVDPAWGEAETATVELQDGWTRTYNCASNDLWDNDVRSRQGQGAEGPQDHLGREGRLRWRGEAREDQGEAHRLADGAGLR